MRLLRLLVAYLLLAIVPVALYVRSDWDTLKSTGRGLRSGTEMEQGMRRALGRAKNRRWIALLGDSTTVCFDCEPRPCARPKVLWKEIEQRLRGTPGERRIVGSGSLGATVYHFYYLLNLLAGSNVRPEFVVMPFNLRSAAITVNPEVRFTEMVGLIRPAEWLSAARLPLSTQGLAFQDVVSGWVDVRIGLRPPKQALEGVRRRTRRWLETNGVSFAIEPPGAPDPNQLSFYRIPMTADHHVVRMWREVAAFAARMQMSLLVYVAPLNVERIARLGLTDEVHAEEKYELIREAVTAYGHQWVDLHDILPAADFQDDLDHVTPEGLDLVAERLAPVVAGLTWSDG